MFKFKWLFRPHMEQVTCERRVSNVMTRLKIEDFHFNWDRNSCYIEFVYQEHSYMMEHSVEKAKEKGVYGIKNGLDSLMELVVSLEDLCRIIERGTYKLEDWVAGMELSSLEEDSPEMIEEYEETNSVRNLIRMR
jgi:hypothetical protein